ncbi:hypothetical protein CPAV1605_109 [seawater metagenome]|uniref:Uncharacterized protein n=1 Tax=seawater metagenome TaxID=1561972 RepID=A0A5E8CH81_9ZZZZ
MKKYFKFHFNAKDKGKIKTITFIIKNIEKIEESTYELFEVIEDQGPFNPDDHLGNVKIDSVLIWFIHNNPKDDLK